MRTASVNINVLCVFHLLHELHALIFRILSTDRVGGSLALPNKRSPGHDMLCAVFNKALE